MPPIPKHLDDPTPVPPTWNRDKVFVATVDGAEFNDADCYGCFFVIKEKGKATWTVNHTATGWRVVSFRDIDSARRAAEMLEGRCAETFRANTPDEVRENAPDWLVKWVLVCEELGVYLDPSETL
jgi:hypothetical protein